MTQNRIPQSTDQLFDQLIEQSQHPINIVEEQNELQSNSYPVQPRQEAIQEGKVVNVQSKLIPNVMRGQSKIEYVPFEKKIIQYKNQTRVEKVPKKRCVTQYREEKRVDMVPRQVIKQDYYAVEHIRHYIPQQFQQKQRVMVPKQIIKKRVQYVPITRKVVHGQPENQYNYHNSYEEVSPYPSYNRSQLNSYGYGEGNSFAYNGRNSFAYNGRNNLYVNQSHFRRSRKLKKYGDMYESYVSDTYI